MTTYKTAELEGALLDAAVCKAEGHALVHRDEPFATGWLEQWPKGHWLWIRHPATHWNDAGPVIERERIMIVPFTERHDVAPLQWCARIGVAYEGYIDDEMPLGDSEVGPTPLIAAMRAYVASKLGETVELP